MAIALGLVAITAAAALLVWKPAVPPVPPPPARSFDRTMVLQGEALAHLGNCRACHTASGSQPFAGGRALHTPFGTIYATNITPDPETGIGRWSATAFVRAMREGISRDGSFLYPAFPYDHFARMSDSDLDALYAYLMSQPAVKTKGQENRLDWPFGYRPFLAIWNLLYVPRTPVTYSDRGRYLAEGLAHCGACHTPRNRMGAEIANRAYDGAWTEGWYAPPLNARSPAVRPWTADELFTYLRTGAGTTHAAAAGPMSEVTRELAAAPEADVRAIADYFARLMADAPAVKDERMLQEMLQGKQSEATDKHAIGAALFAGACAACHDAGAPMMQQRRPPLGWATSLQEKTPHNALHVVVQGLAPAPGRPGPTMPPFGNVFTDRQLAEIAAYLRARYTALPPWQDLETAVSDVRHGVGE